MRYTWGPGRLQRCTTRLMAEPDGCPPWHVESDWISQGISQGIDLGHTVHLAIQYLFLYKETCRGLPYGSGLGLSRCLGPGECLHSFIQGNMPMCHTTIFTGWPAIKEATQACSWVYRVLQYSSWIERDDDPGHPRGTWTVDTWEPGQTARFQKKAQLYVQCKHLAFKRHLPTARIMRPGSWRHVRAADTFSTPTSQALYPTWQHENRLLAYYGHYNSATCPSICHKVTHQ